MNAAVDISIFHKWEVFKINEISNDFDRWKHVVHTKFGNNHAFVAFLFILLHIMN